MRVVAFNEGGKVRFGIRSGGEVRPVTDTSIASPIDVLNKPGIATGPAVPLDGLDLLPPVPAPGKIICMGLNYADHAAEGGNSIPTYPAIFLRVNSSIVAHGKPLLRPKVSDKFDYEAELAIVIGTRGQGIKEADALKHVAGYACFNDGSLRDYQRKSGQWTMGKNFDATGGFGPDIVSPDEISPGAHGLKIMSRINGKLLQNGNTADMIFDVPQMISIISEVMTLEPGDVIITGTPAGVGYPRKPPVFMRDGDVCEIEIEGIGILSNPVKDA